MKFVLVAACLLSNIPITVSTYCEITSHTLTLHGRAIDVRCEADMMFSLKIEDVEEVSTLEVTGNKMGDEFRFLKIEHDGSAKSMILTLNGQRFDVKDENSAAESSVLSDLLSDPNFSNFPAAVQLIHDELKLPGWKSPSVMFLYRIGISLHDHENSQQIQRRSIRKNNKIDRKILHYHGTISKKQCAHNGRKAADVWGFIDGECVGMCGRKCKSCWRWVCGDCCIHRGCLRHDRFCTDGDDGGSAYSGNDCSSFRGVLWDTVTDTKRDC